MIHLSVNSTVGTIRRKIVNSVKDTILRLFKFIIRPRLEYYIQEPEMEKLKKVRARVRCF